MKHPNHCHQRQSLSLLADRQRHFTHRLVDLLLLLPQVVQRIGQAFEVVIRLTKGLLRAVFLFGCLQGFLKPAHSLLVVLDFHIVAFPVLEKVLVRFQLSFVPE